MQRSGTLPRRWCQGSGGVFPLRVPLSGHRQIGSDQAIVRDTLGGVGRHAGVKATFFQGMSVELAIADFTVFHLEEVDRGEAFLSRLPGNGGDCVVHALVPGQSMLLGQQPDMPLAIRLV